MLQKVEKLLDLMIAHYEKELGQQELPTRLSEDVPMTRKRRTPKAVAPAPEPAAEFPIDSIMDLPPLRPVVAVDESQEMTEEESKAEAQTMAQAITRRFKQLGAPGPNGQPAPEGFHMAKKMLAEDFRVGKLGDLVHAQRVQFIAKVKALIAEADSAS